MAAVCVGVLALPVSGRAATIAVPAGGNLQNALNAAAPGDVITLAAGATYTGEFTLPTKSGSQSYITIRSAAADSALPPAGVRITPDYASALPKIRSGSSAPALRTAHGAHHWKLMFLEFQATMDGYYDIIQLGSGDTDQTQLSQVPYALILDRVYVHGDRSVGQKRGIALNSGDTTIVNSYVCDIKANGQDSQAISGYNGPGPYLIENNYLEAATENFLLGGSDPYIPNLVTSNVTFRRNYLSKPLAWRDPIIAAPSGVSASGGSGGSLGAGTYYYRVIARRPSGQGSVARSDGSTEVSATVSAGGKITIAWSAVSGATDYRVYGRTAGAENVYWTTTSTSWTDTGTSGTSGTLIPATKWSVKNLFELKNAQDVVVEGNVFENNWIADQNGFAVVLTPRNQDGGAPWAVVQRVTFRYNLVRHSAGAVNILGTDNEQVSRLTNNITFRDNVFDDIGTAWGGDESRTFQIGDGGDTIVFDHNTIASNDTIVMSIYGGSAGNFTKITRFSYTNNMSEHSTYGFLGAEVAPGLPSIQAYLPSSTITRNVLAGGSATPYPSGNLFPSVSAWRASFINFAGGDYRLQTSSAYRYAGTDGLDLGANINMVLSSAANALSGDNRLGLVPMSAPSNLRLYSR